ncbi:Acetyl-hydrolase, putative [Perkinsus marinus ATCC 50983]|uniref:Acetyl-hydrolase, putative n=1 Tax=Perkinsus marinus (strain ATCC 50983 / TXsc) TaxID=423536 RepID=C5LV07_PERM5|nr:Acetyl-hydrolase, putative [Perkinsus marinus ATCC 50983]EEQ99422.1 Acetyl-hydrolase, putative [Perkinsus marinus ATCC 50983]|eukprot:XP_002766705.1 Acetyl-hydrolase, putative [Perkinsus marinus ATCC 50983]
MRTGLSKIVRMVAHNVGQSQATFMADRALANWFGRYLGKYWQRKYKFDLKKVQVSPSCTVHVLSRIAAAQEPPETSRWLMYLHGGGFCMLDPRYYYGLAAHIARDGRFQGVVIPDFRLSPDFGYPAQLEDCLSTYDWLREDQKAAKVAIAGDSSGGNLAAAVTLEKKDTPPEAVALFSPFLDLTISGETYDLNADTDRLVSKTNARRAAEMYVSGKFEPITTEEVKTKSLSEAVLCDSVKFYEKVSGASLPPLSELVKQKEYSRHEKNGKVLELFPHQPHAFEAFAPKKPSSELAIESVSRFFNKSLADTDTTTEKSIYRDGDN